MIIVMWSKNSHHDEQKWPFWHFLSRYRRVKDFSEDTFSSWAPLENFLSKYRTSRPEKQWCLKKCRCHICNHKLFEDHRGVSHFLWSDHHQNLLKFTLRGTWISETNFMAIHPTVVEITNWNVYLMAGGIRGSPESVIHPLGNMKVQATRVDWLHWKRSSSCFGQKIQNTTNIWCSVPSVCLWYAGILLMCRYKWTSLWEGCYG